MRPQRARGWLVLAALTLLAACETAVPRDALTLDPQSLEQRRLQTRRFDGISETDILAASAGVLQDLGFVLDESEASLGVLVASKQRSARNPLQQTAQVLLFLVGVEIEVDDKQKIRASLVTRPAVKDADPDSHYVRVTFQRIVWNTGDEITKIEGLADAELYQGFFEKLSKSVFLEAHKI